MARRVAVVRQTEVFAAGGLYFYRFGGDAGIPQGMSRIEAAEDRTLESLSGMNLGGRTASVMSFDLTGPLGASNPIDCSSVTCRNTERRDTMFGHEYDVVTG